jgi:general secretion pathway protein C
MAAEATMTAKGSKRGARVLSLALLVALGAYLADRVMLFTTPPPAVPGATAAPVLAPTYDRQRLLQTALFGTAAGPATAGPAVNAPETRLALTLHGLFSGSSESSALISAAGGQPRRYLEGASLPGGAVLAEVQKDQVLLRRQGQLEALRFPKGAAAAGFRAQGAGNSADGAALSALPSTLPGIRDTRRPQSTSPNLSPSRQRSASTLGTPSVGTPGTASAFSPRSALRAFQGALAEQGEAALASYGLAPASGGAGLEINNQVPAAALAQVGLRPGDRILTVNGQGVDGLAQNPQQIDAVLASGSARLEIQRGQRTFFVTAPIPE